MSIYSPNEKTAEEVCPSHSISEESLKSPLLRNNFNEDINTIDVKKNRSLSEMIPAFGLWMSFFSVLCYSFASVIVKVLVEFHSLQLLAIRCAFQSVFYLFITIIFKLPFFGVSGHRLSLILRGVFGTVAASCIYMAYRMIPLSDASTLHFSAPVFVTILAFFILKERLTVLQIGTTLVTFIGMVVIAKPDFIFNPGSQSTTNQRIEGISLSITAAFMTGLALILLRKLKTTPISVVIMWYAGINVVSVLTYLVIDDQLVMPSGWYQYSLLLLLGIIGIAEQYFKTLSLHYESAGPISVARTLNVVLAFVWDVTLFAQPLDWTSIVGAILISGCVIVLGLFKWKDEKPEQFDKIKNKLGFGNQNEILESNKLITGEYSNPCYNTTELNKNAVKGV